MDSTILADEPAAGSSSATRAPGARAGRLHQVRRLLGYALPYRRRLFLAVGALLAGSGLGLIYPLYFGAIIDAAFTERDLVALDEATLTLVAIFAGQAVFVFVRHYSFSWVGERIVADLRIELYEHLVGASRSFLQRERTGALLSRQSEDVSKIHGMVSAELSVAARNLVTLVGGVAIMVWANAYLTLMMLVVVPPLALATVYFGRRIHQLARGVQDRLASANAELQEGLTGIEVVQAFTREEHEVGRYRDAIGEAFELFRTKAMANAWFLAIATFATFATVAGIFWLGGNLVARSAITPGQLTQFMLYTMVVAGALGFLSSMWSNLQSALGASARVFEILDTPSELEVRPDPVVLEDVRGELWFRGVTFAYGNREGEVLRNVELRVHPGQSCALVGPSGSGKSTIARLVLRFYDPGDGAVMLDGHDLRDLDLGALRRSMAIVSQDPLLFSRSIAENIRYGNLDASDDDIVRAAKLANAHDFIVEFPEGYGTRVGERGAQLSGGQRQRISIARAILRDPEVLVLDEATSALDAHSEGLVQAALDELQRGRTTLVIAHRLSTIRNADRIVVMERGRIVEEGTHDQLAARRGAYARLVARQTTMETLDDED